jgi:signal transduction histidine kinase
MNTVREEEQARLARELHDQLGGLLTRRFQVPSATGE